MTKPILLMAVAVLAGYFAVILAYLIVTFLITSLMPTFVMQKGRFTSSYTTLHALLWAVCGFAGGYVATVLAPVEKSYQPFLPAGILLLTVSYIVFTNTGQMNRSKVSQTLLAALGIAGGTALCLAL